MLQTNRRGMEGRQFVGAKYTMEVSHLILCCVILHDRTSRYWDMAHFIMCHCDLDFGPIFTKIGSRHRELVLNVCTYFVVYSHVAWCHTGGQSLYLVLTEYDLCSRVRTTPIFHWPPAKGPNFYVFLWGGKGVKFQISSFNPQKALSWPEPCIMRYWAWGWV